MQANPKVTGRKVGIAVLGSTNKPQAPRSTHQRRVHNPPNISKSSLRAGRERGNQARSDWQPHAGAGVGN